MKKVISTNLEYCRTVREILGGLSHLKDYEIINIGLNYQNNENVSVARYVFGCELEYLPKNLEGEYTMTKEQRFIFYNPYLGNLEKSLLGANLQNIELEGYLSRNGPEKDFFNPFLYY